MAARATEALAAHRKKEAQARAAQATRDAVRAEAAASVAAVARRAGARTLAQALAAFGCAVPAGGGKSDVDAAFRRAALRFHPDRQQRGAAGGDELARLRAASEAEETLKLLSALRARGA